MTVKRKRLQIIGIKTPYAVENVKANKMSMVCECFKNNGLIFKRRPREIKLAKQTW